MWIGWLQLAGRTSEKRLLVGCLIHLSATSPNMQQVKTAQVYKCELQLLLGFRAYRARIATSKATCARAGAVDITGIVASHQNL